MSECFVPHDRSNSRKIMVLFGGGFLSHNIAKFFQDTYDIILFTRKFENRGVKYWKVISGLDLRENLDRNIDYGIGGNGEFIENLVFINCAAVGSASDAKKQWGSPVTFIDNLQLYKTFYEFYNRYEV